MAGEEAKTIFEKDLNQTKEEIVHLTVKEFLSEVNVDPNEKRAA